MTWQAGNAPGRGAKRTGICIWEINTWDAFRRIVRCLTLRYREEQAGTLIGSICGFPLPRLIPGSKYFSEYPYMNQEEYTKTTRDSIRKNKRLYNSNL